MTDETLFNLNADGEINILDLVLAAQSFGKPDSKADGAVNVLDLVQIANHL